MVLGELRVALLIGLLVALLAAIQDAHDAHRKRLVLLGYLLSMIVARLNLLKTLSIFGRDGLLLRQQKEGQQTGQYDSVTARHK